MKNKYVKILSICIVACIILTGNISYARLIGKNNNKNDWVGKINANMDKIANHFVDSVIQDEIDDAKYKESEEEGVLHDGNAHIATLSCATPSCATLSDIKGK
ncbi:MAG: hypothetical protein MJ151_00335 [Lachnospiraceae bacterium]|nr:hypothetical protein [Lachnospiraceae bacterium]